MRLALFKLAALVVGTLVALALGEVFLRVYNPLGQRIYGDRIVLPKNVRRTITNDGNPKIDPVVEFSTNSIGFRGAEPPRDFDRALTVVAIGGSTTECLFLSSGMSWPEVTGRFLEPSFDPLWVNNAGLDGHSTYGHLFLLDQIVGRMRPKVALFLVGINDVGREGARGRERATRRRTPPLSIRLARHSAILAAVINLRREEEARERHLGHEQLDIEALPAIRPDRDLEAVLLAAHRERYVPGYRERVEAVVSTSRDYGIEPVLMTQPALYGPGVDPLTLVNLGAIVVGDEQRIKAGDVRGALAWDILELYNEVVRAVGREKSVLVIDAAAELPKSSQFFYDFVHFTNDGARELARLTVRELCPFLAERFPEFERGGCPTIEPLPVGGDTLVQHALRQLNGVGVLDLGDEPDTELALVGAGWLDPVKDVKDVENGELDYRPSRGRRSWLNIPLAESSARKLVLRVRSELESDPLEVDVDVNGHRVSTLSPSRHWAEYTIEVPAETVVAGLNTITLTYSDTPRTLDPSFRGLNTSLAVDWLRFSP